MNILNIRLRRDRIAFLAVVSVLLVSLLGALPLATVRAATKLPATPTLERADRNKDGFIDRKEAQSVPELLADFPKMDRNGDGKLDRVEFARW